jgi:uncharacterized iron-regulated membrane protein
MLILLRLIIFSHRYLGIAISLMAVIWFASGIVMIYAGGMPRLSEQMRLDRLPALDLARVQLSPVEAEQRLEGGGRPVLLSVLDRPAYRFQGRQAQTVFADSGEILQDIDLDTAHRVASRFVGVPGDRVHFVRTLDGPDQWNIGGRGETLLHKFRVDDTAATELYVSPRTAEVVQLTTRKQRAMAWTGTIPHWLYFTALRTNQPLWYKTVVWLSALCCVLAVLGLILAFTQFRWSQPLPLSGAIPYRGWLRWHYITGAIFGVFVLTWAFSGLLSMEPFDWTNARGLEVRRDAFTGGRTELASFGSIDAAALVRAVGDRTIKEIGFKRIHGDYYYTVAATEHTPAADAKRERLHQPYLVGRRGEPGRLLISAQTMQARNEPFDTAAIVARLKSATPDATIVGQETLQEYDSYYYSRGGQSPLPVLRVKFDDPAQTWVYIDPSDSEVLAQVHRFSRLERWLYNGLHSLDFAFWYSKRPLWDIGVIVLLLGGLATSLFGLYLGIKRLIRDLTPAGAADKEIVSTA